MSRIPKRLQGVLWSVSVDKLDLNKNKRYIIHQILAYGTWDDIKWLFKTYTKSEISKVFTSYPSKDYKPEAFNFVSKYLLNLKKLPDERYYVTTYPRIIG